MRSGILLGVSFLLAVLVVGCSSDFESNYVPEEMGRLYAPTTAVTAVAYSPEKLESLKGEGYRLIGTSTFVAPQQGAQKDMQQAAEFGKKAGAEVVLYESRFHDKSTEVRPVTTYQPGQKVTYQGVDGRKPYHGTATTDPTYKTTYVPVTVDRYERKVYYLRKAP